MLDGVCGSRLIGDELDLAAVVAVDEAGRVDQRQALSEGAPASRLHEASAPLRDRQSDAGWDERTMSGLKYEVHRGEEIEASIAVVGICR